MMITIEDGNFSKTSIGIFSLCDIIPETNCTCNIEIIKQHCNYKVIVIVESSSLLLLLYLSLLVRPRSHCK